MGWEACRKGIAGSYKRAFRVLQNCSDFCCPKLNVLKRVSCTHHRAFLRKACMGIASARL